MFAIIRRMARGSLGVAPWSRTRSATRSSFESVLTETRCMLQLVEAKRKSLDTFMREAMARSKAGGGAGAGASAAR